MTNRKRSSHSSNTGLYLVGFCVLVLVLYFMFSGKLPGLQVSSDETNNNTNDTTNNYYNEQNGNPQSGLQLAPTSLTVTVTPNPVEMGKRILGQVISNGYNWPITIYAKLIGTGQTQSFGGLLDASGRFQQIQLMNTPGYWEFWVTSGSVTSNTARLTVVGMRVECAKDTYSKSLMDSLLIKVYSTYTGNVGIIANDPVHAISYPVTNCIVDSKGYGEIAPSLDFLPVSGYEIDGHISGHKASDYGATYWVTVGR